MARIYYVDDGKEVNLPVHHPLRSRDIDDETLMALQLDETCITELMHLPRRFWSIITSEQLQTLLSPANLAKEILHRIDNEHVRSLLGGLSFTNVRYWQRLIPAPLRPWCHPGALLEKAVSKEVLVELMDLRLDISPTELEMIIGNSQDTDRLTKLHCALTRLPHNQRGPRTEAQLKALYQHLNRAEQLTEPQQAHQQQTQPELPTHQHQQESLSQMNPKQMHDVVVRGGGRRQMQEKLFNGDAENLATIFVQEKKKKKKKHESSSSDDDDDDKGESSASEEDSYRKHKKSGHKKKNSLKWKRPSKLQ